MELNGELDGREIKHSRRKLYCIANSSIDENNVILSLNLSIGFLKI